MERKIQRLLAQLDDESLRMLPCFWDNPLIIQFRIGLNQGPQINLAPATDDQWTIRIRNHAGEEISWPVAKDSGNFNSCQHIYQFIRSLSDDREYQEILNNGGDRLGAMIGNLENIVKLIINNPNQ